MFFCMPDLLQSVMLTVHASVFVAEQALNMNQVKKMGILALMKVVDDINDMAKQK